MIDNQLFKINLFKIYFLILFVKKAFKNARFKGFFYENTEGY